MRRSPVLFPIGLACVLAAAMPLSAGTLSGSFAAVPQGSIVNLTTNGVLDWVHWGLYTETSINRKDGVLPQISDFTLLDSSNGFSYVYQYADNYNGYSWTDGTPVAAVTNTTTGVWAYGTPNIGSGFEITAPADTEVRTLKVYVGVFAGEGTLIASLSDGSAASYINGTLLNLRNGPGRVYTLQYAANSADQTLQVRWTLSSLREPSANVTLQAAALSAPGADNPPVVRLTNPANEANFAAPASFSLAAAATDADGKITKVEFYEGGTRLGEATTTPYSIPWTSSTPGRYTFTAVATDTGGQTSTSSPRTILVYTSGGSLTGTEALPPQNVDLTTEGTVDWVHWGLSPSNVVNRKEGVVAQISPLVLLGANKLETYADNYTAFNWIDGTPTASANNATDGAFVYGQGNGFELTLPADTTMRQLRIYAGLYGAQSHLEAWLSDFSAPGYHNHSLSNAFGNDYGVFTLDYAAAGAGQVLTVHYTAERLFDFDFGNVTLQAVTLQGGGVVLHPLTLLSPARAGDEFQFSFLTDPGFTYYADYNSTLGSATWENFANVVGTGGRVWVTNSSLTDSQRFYRVRRE